MKNTPADKSIHTRLGVSDHTYERLLTEVPKIYIKHLQTATNIAELIADAGNELLEEFCPVIYTDSPRTPDEIEQRDATALLIGIMLWQTHTAALSQTPAPLPPPPQPPPLRNT